MNDRLKMFPTTDLSDAHPDEVRQVQLQFRDFGGRGQFCGQVRTALTVDDSKRLQEELFSIPGNGDVIVIDAGGSLRTAMLGDRMGERLVTNGWSGLVVFGAVRDSAKLSELDLGIKALAVTTVRSEKKGTGAIDVPVAFGGVLFEPGKYIYCDEDGVLVADKPLSL